MTPDSPKGPERATHTWTERSTVAGAMEDAEAGIPANCANWHIASVVLHDEVERLTAEVERLQSELEGAEEGRHYVRYGVGKALSPLFTDEQIDKILIDPVQLAELVAAEVSRLREQLAAAVVIPKTAEAQLLDVFLEAQGGVGLAVAEAVLKRVRSWGVSSSEVEAPQPQPLQHSTHTWEVDGIWHGLCVTFECGERVRGCRAAVEYWKDQHEAGTLVPKVVQPGEFFEENEPVEKVVAAFDSGLKFTTAPSTSAAPIHLEGRPSGSERLAPRPSEAAALVRDFHEAFGLPINDTTRTLNKLRANLVREEGNEAADAIEDDGPEAWAKELADLVIVAYGAALTLGIDLDEAVRLVHHSNMSKLGTDGKPVMRPDGKVLKGPNYVPPDMSSALFQDAAQAARSEATPEDSDVEHDDLADFPLENLRDWKSVRPNVITRPISSPSLRKEGGDTPSPSVSTQEEKAGETDG